MEISSSNRLAQLDFLRAVAIVLVIGNHAAICPPETNVFFNKITSLWYRGGWAGVDLFFVLSGFLIGGLLFNEFKKYGTIDLKRFLIRRGFKIYPAFWFFTFITLVITVLSGEMVYRGGFLSELFFIQNYKPGIWDHTWSLAVEEHFYIFLSLLFFIILTTAKNISEKTFDIIPKIFLLLAVVCLFWRHLYYDYAGFSYVINMELTHLRIDSLFFGVFLSYLWNFRGLGKSEFLRNNKFVIGLTGVCCFVPAFMFDLDKTFWLETYGLTLLYLGGGCLLLALLKSDFGESRVLGKISEIGKYSYSIYLWNLPTHFWLMKFTNLAAENWYLYISIYWAGTMILGIGTAKLIEYPVLRLRDKIIPTKISVLEQVNSYAVSR